MGMNCKDAAPDLRIGMVNFINTAPLYEVWKETVREPSWQVVEETPARLNALLAAGEIDLGLVSSHEYAQAPENYRLLPDLSISASGAVGSVFLFSRVPVAELDRAQVLLSPSSQTSNSLVKIILEEFYRLVPNYETDMAAEPTAQALVAIGDRALRLCREGGFAEVLDLSQCWHRHLGLPFVFAVWAVRREAVWRAPGAIGRLHGELLRCVGEGRARLSEISRRVAPRIPMPAAECHRYLQRIEYDLSERKLLGLRRFYDILINRGEAPATALPINFVNPAAPDAAAP